MKSVLAVLSLWVPGISSIIKRTFGKVSEKSVDIAFSEVVEFEKLKVEKAEQGHGENLLSQLVISPDNHTHGFLEDIELMI